MTESDQIIKLRRGVMCAIIHLFSTHPDDVINVFNLDELEEFANETAHLQPENLEMIYKDILDLTK